MQRHTYVPQGIQQIDTEIVLKDHIMDINRDNIQTLKIIYD